MVNSIQVLSPSLFLKTSHNIVLHWKILGLFRQKVLVFILKKCEILKISWNKNQEFWNFSATSLSRQKVVYSLMCGHSMLEHVPLTNNIYFIRKCIHINVSNACTHLPMRGVSNQKGIRLSNNNKLNITWHSIQQPRKNYRKHHTTCRNSHIPQRKGRGLLLDQRFFQSFNAMRKLLIKQLDTSWSDMKSFKCTT